MSIPLVGATGAVIDTMTVDANQILPQVSRKVMNRDANIAPFTHLMRMMNKMPIGGTTTYWWETQQLPQHTTINFQAGYDAAAVTFVVVDPTYFCIGDVIIIPRTGETMIILSVNIGASTITVINRSQGATAAAALLNGDDIFRIGVAKEEHSLKGAAIMVKPVRQSAYLQIWRIPVEESETSAYTEKWTGDERSRQRLEKRDLLMLELEKAAWFGENSEVVGPLGHPLRTAGGFVERIRAVNLHDVSGLGATTEAIFRAQILNAWDYTSGELYLFASNLFCDRLDTFGVSRLQLIPKDQTYGVSVRRWLSTMGELRVINNKLFSGTVYGTYAAVVDMSKCFYVPQAGQDIRLVLGIQENDRHGYVDEWRVTAGYRFEIPVAHQLITGIN